MTNKPKHDHLNIESTMKKTRDDFLRKYIRMQLEEYKKKNNINEWDRVHLEV